MDFNELIGNEKIIKYLDNSIYHKRISHSYIFEGISGIGKMKIAKNFSKKILCENKERKICNNCNSCIKFNSKNHPDFKIIIPDGKSIKNKQIEDFQKFIITKPYYGDYKVVIIDEAETMTISAQNRILKTIEDAPEHLTVIFICKSATSMISTIRSRCQSISFNRVEKDIIVDYLIKKHEVTCEDAKIFAGFSDGSVKKALDVAFSEEFKKFRKLSIDVIEEIHLGHRAKVFGLFENIKNFNEYSLENFLDLLLVFYRDILMLVEFNLKNMIINIDYIEDIKKISILIDKRKLVKYIELIEDSKKMIKENINEILALESLFVNIQEV